MSEVLRPYQFSLESDRKIATVITLGSVYVARYKGERLAPVVVVMKPKHLVGTGATIKRFVISTRLKTILDLDGLLETLNEKEQWTRHIDCIESASNSSSQYKLDQIVEIVKQHLLPKQTAEELATAAAGGVK